LSKISIKEIPGGVLTPVIWKDKVGLQEVFIDAELPACPSKNTSCPDLLSEKISRDSAEVDSTLLSYGVNKDEYRDEPAAYKAAQKPAENPPFITTLKGIMAGPNGTAAPISLEVGSFVIPKGDIFILQYTITLGEPSIPVAFAPSNEVAFSKEVPVLVWGAAESKEFYSAINKLG
jgi:hypothetical protein